MENGRSDVHVAVSQIERQNGSNLLDSLLISPNRSRVGVATLNGKLYAFGGFNGSERLSTVEVYDPKTKAWYQGKAMLCKRSAVGVSSRVEDFKKKIFCVPFRHCCWG